MDISNSPIKNLSSYDSPIPDDLLSELGIHILQAIPDEGCSLAELEDLLDDQYRALSSDVIRDEVYTLWAIISIDIGRGREAHLVRLEHTERSRTLLENPAITEEALVGSGVVRAAADAYPDPHKTHENARYGWFPAGSSRYKLRSNCGHVKRDRDTRALLAGACSEDHEHDRRVSHQWCESPTCCTCIGAYAAAATAETLDRLLGGYEAVKRDHDVDLGPLKTWILSPPPERGLEALESPEAFRALRDELKHLCENVWGIQGAAVAHPFRVSAWAKAAYRKAKAEHKAGLKAEKLIPKGARNEKFPPLWRWLQKQHGMLEASEGAVYLSLHWHISGYGYVDQDSRDIQKDTGWMLKLEKNSWDIIDRVPVGRPREDRPAPSRDDLERKIMYPFTHVGSMVDIENMFDEAGELQHKRKWSPLKALTWLGAFTSQRMAKITDKKEEPAYCVTCGADVVCYSWPDPGDDEVFNMDTGLWDPAWEESLPTPIPWMELVVETTYYMRDRGPPPDQGASS